MQRVSRSLCNLLFADVDECNTPGSNNCSSNANCVSNPGSFECQCKSGYTGDGANCSGRLLVNKTLRTVVHIIMRKRLVCRLAAGLHQYNDPKGIVLGNRLCVTESHYLPSVLVCNLSPSLSAVG